MPFRLSREFPGEKIPLKETSSSETIFQSLRHSVSNRKERKREGRIERLKFKDSNCARHSQFFRGQKKKKKFEYLNIARTEVF